MQLQGLIGEIISTVCAALPSGKLSIDKVGKVFGLKGKVENAGHQADGAENEDDEEESGEEAPTRHGPSDGAVSAKVVHVKEVRHQIVRSFAGLLKGER